MLPGYWYFNLSCKLVQRPISDLHKLPITIGPLTLAMTQSLLLSPGYHLASSMLLLNFGHTYFTTNAKQSYTEKAYSQNNDAQKPFNLCKLLQ